MGWRFMVAVIVAVVLMGGGLPAVAAADPMLRALDFQPFVVRGTGFRPFERVKLFLPADGASRTVKATRGGTFVARFAGVQLGRCQGFVLQAVGSSGSRAELARLAPDCAEP